MQIIMCFVIHVTCLLIVVMEANAQDIIFLTDNDDNVPLFNGSVYPYRRGV